MLKPRGQSSLEFAALAPAAFFLLFGVIQSGMMIYAYSFISYAARDAVRYASVHGSTSGSPTSSSAINTYVQGLSAGLNTSQLSATATFTPDESPGSVVQVQVTYHFQPLRPFSQTTVTLRSTTQTTISY